MNKNTLFFLAILVIPTISFAQKKNPDKTPIDTILKHQLESIKVKDQTLRLLLPDVKKMFGANSEEEKHINKLIRYQDSILIIAVLDIIDTHGWLGINRVGSVANQAIWLVIQHADLEIQEKYLPYLKNSVRKGESEGWYLAFLEDRILMRKGQKQIYGSQALYDKISGRFHIYPIKDAEDINKRRRQLGLEPIEEYAKKNGYIFNP